MCQGQSRCKACAPHMPAMHSLALTSQCHHNHSLANDSHVQCGRTVVMARLLRRTMRQNGGNRVWRLCGQSAVLAGSSSSQVQHGESVARLCSCKGETRATIFLNFTHFRLSLAVLICIWRIAALPQSHHIAFLLLPCVMRCTYAPLHRSLGSRLA